MITSGYRSSALNDAIGGSDSSQHMQGEAADIVIPGMHPRQVIYQILRLNLPFDQVIEEFGRWTHVSAVSNKTPRGQILIAKRVWGVVKYTPVSKEKFNV